MFIKGCSDDLVYWENGGNADEIGCYDQDVRITLGNDRSGGILLVMSYGPDDLNDGCWQARLAPIAEDVRCPWLVRVSVDRYSAIVDIECPADVQMRIERRPRGKSPHKWTPIGDEP